MMMELRSILFALLLCLMVCAVPSHGSVYFFRGRLFHDDQNDQQTYSFKKGDLEVAPEKWFTQTLDHFNPSDTRTWQQRYFVNDSSYRPGGPVFLQIGGEGTADPIWLQQGQIAERYAPIYGAYQVYLEHRYYGKSHPTEDISVENLQYLTSEQALADAAMFITKFKEMDPRLKNSKWIAFGGSYSGSLAAWIRLKYPHLISGSIASSAPLVALINFTDYIRVVRDNLGPDCDAEIATATKQIERLLQHPMGWRTLTKTFSLCKPLNATNTNDLYQFVSTLVGNIEGVVQYNKDNRDFEGAKATNITIDTVCGIMTDNNAGSALQRYAKVQQTIMSAYEQQCIDYTYDEFIKSMRNESWAASASEGGRQWTWQTCREFGFFQSSDLEDQPFGPYFPADFFVQQCQDIFGKEYNATLLQAGIDFTNANYGERDPAVTKVAFPNGSVDPWHALGRLTDLNPSSPAIFINGTAHCADMYPDSPDDLPQLRAARDRIAKLIGKFLQD